MTKKDTECSGAKNGFTLVETLVAISLLTIAIVAPMSLTMLALSSAIYARDQITAYYLAQEGIEAVRSVRDGNILASALGTPTPIMDGIPSSTGAPFTVDTHTVPATLLPCPGGVCPVLQTNSSPSNPTGDLYGYAAGWTSTAFTRAVRVTYVTPDEARVSVTVSWSTGSFNERSFTISDNLYAWINTGTETVVVGGGVSIIAVPSSVAVNGSVTSAITNRSSPSVYDWVGVYATGNPGCNNWIDWRYLNGSRTPPATPYTSATLTFTMPTAGTYNYQLYTDNVCQPTPLATSNTVTVTP